MARGKENQDKIIVTGSGTAVIRQERSPSSFLLQLGGQSLLFDCGWGTGINLIRAGIPLKNIDHIIWKAYLHE